MPWWHRRPTGAWLANGWPMFDYRLANCWPIFQYRLTRRQRHALVAQEANRGLLGQWLANV